MTVKELKDVLTTSQTIYITQWNDDAKRYDSIRIKDLDEFETNTDFDDFNIESLDIFNGYMTIEIERME